ncbi:hypothetical protein MTS1_00358 [Microbacterium sp. TS-1]|jgi:hypothetical protein|uniref:Urease accessory protein n=1 Tax=Microbacterium arborescens TaxID=33883 RepID=A0ABX2WG61_9MICO|nr:MULTISPECIES: hypothetical protein [Microbacterium]OAZ39674.1 hypothetical protein A9Z40_07515 [Microbacterium arborescens]QCR40363.1 hypothetical protein C1N74_07965 [Microbacterium sp. SGAir0570]GAD33014.1 hypothetical protein MTS1_00358 [Microbacterium sp. TS-1]
MSERLLFPHPEVARDVLTFAGRAARHGDGIVRLQARGGLLALSCAPLSPRSLTDPTPFVLALRTARVDPELECDLTVDAAALAPDADDGRAVRLPDSGVTAAWAGVSPPRAGWREAGSLDSARVSLRAQWGIAAVARQLPTGAGDDVVHRVRSSVWGAPDEDLAGLPLGVAFAAVGMGFIAGAEQPVVRRTDVWTRVSFARGHVLTRGPVAMGLTPVRATGPAR